MILTEQVFSQAVLLAGELEDKQEALLKMLCGAATASLSARLRDGIAPEDCRADFVAAASLFALAALNEAVEGDRITQFTGGDVTLKTAGGGAASNCLRYQAQMIIGPYLKDRFTFREV
jgi:hypothetical protein